MELSMAKRKGDTGKNFENEIRRGLKGSKEIWWFRIQDTGDWIGTYASGGKTGGKKAINEKQPADFFTVYKGRPIMLEAKTSRSRTAFPLYYGSGRSIATHQIDYALKLKKHGGIALILIRSEQPRNKKAWAITPAQAKYWYSKKWTAKSVKWAWIEKHGKPIQRMKAPLRWNIEKLYETIT